MWSDPITRDLDAQLAAKGLTKVASAGLVVDAFDGQTKHLVWRATSTETLSGDPEKNEKKLEHEVADMFKHFPPERK